MKGGDAEGIRERRGREGDRGERMGIGKEGKERGRSEGG